MLRLLNLACHPTRTDGNAVVLRIFARGAPCGLGSFLTFLLQ
jgi:hypothetical protein